MQISSAEEEGLWRKRTHPAEITKSPAKCCWVGYLGAAIVVVRVTQGCVTLHTFMTAIGRANNVTTVVSNDVQVKYRVRRSNNDLCIIKICSRIFESEGPLVVKRKRVGKRIQNSATRKTFIQSQNGEEMQ